jgi:hypothetical protein
MQAIYEQISSLMKDLDKDADALTWFNLSTDTVAKRSSPPPCEYPSTPLACPFLFKQNFNVFVDIPSHPKDPFHGGLASPPESRYNSPTFPFGQTSALQRGNFSPPQCVNPRDLHDRMEPSSPASEVEKLVQDDKDDKDASPPESHYNLPILPLGQTSAFQRGNFSPPQCVNPRDLHDGMEPPFEEAEKPVQVTTKLTKTPGWRTCHQRSH